MNDLRFCEWIRQESEATSGPGAVHQRLIEATDRLAAATVEIERLRAIVDKLPKTADGVVIIAHKRPTVWVWTKRTGLYRPNEGPGWWPAIVEHYDGDRLMMMVAGSHIEKVSPSQCYSTREAAEAAGGNNGTCHPETGEPK